MIWVVSLTMDILFFLLGVICLHFSGSKVSGEKGKLPMSHHLLGVVTIHPSRQDRSSAPLPGFRHGDTLDGTSGLNQSFKNTTKAFFSKALHVLKQCMSPMSYLQSH